MCESAEARALVLASLLYRIRVAWLWVLSLLGLWWGADAVVTLMILPELTYSYQLLELSAAGFAVSGMIGAYSWHRRRPTPRQLYVVFAVWLSMRVATYIWISIDALFVKDYALALIGSRSAVKNIALAAVHLILARFTEPVAKVTRP